MSRVTASLRRSAAFLLFTGAAALIAGAPAANTARAADNAPIAIKATELEPTPDPSLSFNGMAEAMGLFAKHGLVLEPGPKLGGGGPARVQAVVTDNTEVATSDIISVIGGIYSGAKIKILMVMTPYGDEEVWGQDKYKTLKDAVGQSWGVASLGGAQRFNAQMTAEGMGFKADAFQWIAISGADGRALAGARHRPHPAHQPLASRRRARRGQGLHQAGPRSRPAHVEVHSAGAAAGRRGAERTGSRTHQDAATRYVEMMLDANRQWQDNADSWIGAAQKIYKEAGLNEQQLHAAWQQFRDGGYFSVNGGINFAATQKIMDLFFKLRNESPNEYLSKPADVYDTGPLKAALDKMGVVKGTPGLPDTPDWYKSKARAAK